MIANRNVAAAAALAANVGIVGRRVHYTRDKAKVVYLVVESHFAMSIATIPFWWLAIVDLETGQLSSAPACDLTLCEVPA